MTVRVVARRPPPWRRFSTLAAVENEIGVGVGSSSGGLTGLEFPGSPSFPSADPTIQLVWGTPAGTANPVPPLSGGFTALWWCIPRALQDAYWSGFFHVAYRTAWGGGGSNDAAALRYCGMHPYPEPTEGGATRNLFEISYNFQDLYKDSPADPNYSRITAYDRMYFQAMRATPDGSEVHYEYFFDMPEDGSALGPVLNTEPEGAGDTKSDPSDAQRVILVGDARWNEGKEIYNGALGGYALFGSRLSDANLLLARVNPIGIGGLYYYNPNMTPSDVTDKSGNGNHPAFLTVARPTLYDTP